MRKLAFIPVALLCIGAAPPPPDAARPAASAASDAPGSTSFRTERGLPGEIVLTPPAHCLFDTAPRQAQGQTLTPRRLDQLPQGNLSLTVMRDMNGCPESTTIREGYGAPGFRAEPATSRP